MQIIAGYSYEWQKRIDSYEDWTVRRALSWPFKTKFSLMEYCLSGNKKCGVCEVQNMLAYGGKCDGKKAEGIREVTFIIVSWVIISFM